MSKKLIGLKLADGTFYPVLNEGIPVKKHLKVTASSDNQTSMKIELFRASDESFSDAEYIQTMVLDQMLPQKKEDHLIDLVINLDENDVLTADLSDAQSGLKKNASIPLADFAGLEGNEPVSDADGADSVVEDFLATPLADEPADEALPAFDEPADKAMPDFGDLDIPEEPAADIAMTDEPATTEELPDFGDFDIPEESAGDDVITEEPVGETDTGLPVFDDLGGTEPAADSADNALPDFGDFDTAEPDVEGADSVVEDFLATPLADESADEALAAFDEPADKAMPDLGDLDVPDEPAADIAITDEPVTTDELPDFGDFDIPEESVADSTDGALPDSDGIETGESVADSELPDFGALDIPEEPASDNAITDEPVTTEELPDFGDFDIPEESVAEEPVTNAELPSFDDNDLSFSDNSGFDDIKLAGSDSDTFDAGVLPDFSDDSSSDAFSPETFDIDSLDLDSDDMDFAETGTEDVKSDDDTYTQSQGITDFDFLDKKTRLPFVPLLCIICAVVSLLCLLGMFFIFLNGKSKNTVPVQPTAQEQQNRISVYSGSSEPEKPAQAAVARDNVIVVVDSPCVIPAVPEKIVTEADEKKYKVKWGDTLWDIAESYYKDPWMYKKIAALNNIKNPDFILSGTWIVLPPK